MTNRKIGAIFGLAFWLLCFAAAGCGRPFHIKTSPGFVELGEQARQGFLYRATTPDGVVIGVRVVEDEDRGDLPFWVRSLTLQLRDTKGYALLASTDVKSSDGTPGKRLRFGSDEGNKPYLYEIALFRTADRLFLVESGGPKELVERAGRNLDWMLATFKVRCNTFVSPVLASRTCNRW
ncbi:MAG: serine/threonine protein kinase [Polyangiaceae bacterium]